MQKFALGLLSLLFTLMSCGCQGKAPPTKQTASPKASPTVAATPTITAAPTSSRELKPLREISHGGFYDQYLMFSPDGRFLVSWLPEGILVYEVTTGEAVGSIPKGHTPLAFSEDGSSLYTVGLKKLYRWACPGLEKPESVEKPQGESPDGAWKLVKTSAGGDVLVGNRGRLINWPSYSEDYPVSPYNVCHTADGSLIAYSTGSQIAVMRPGVSDGDWTSEPVGRSLTSLAVSEDGTTAAAGGMSGTLALFDLSGPSLQASSRIPGEIRCLAMDSKGETLVIGCGDGMTGATVIDLRNGNMLGQLEPKYSNVWSVAVSRDGSLIAVGADDGKIRLFQLSEKATE